MSDIRPMTKSEKAWWTELKRILRRMPKNVELHARCGDLGIAPYGARDAAFLRDGAQTDFSILNGTAFRSVASMEGTVSYDPPLPIHQWHSAQHLARQRRHLVGDTDRRPARGDHAVSDGG